MGNPYSYDSFPTNEQRLQHIRQTREEIISKIENGAERYQTDALTYNTVEHLSLGVDPIVIIDHLLKSHANLQAQFVKMFHAEPVAYSLPTEAVDNLLKTIKK